jgi:hypothetical protein
MEYIDPFIVKKTWRCRKHKIDIVEDMPCPMCLAARRAKKNRTKFRRLEMMQSDYFKRKNREAALAYYYKHRKKILEERKEKRESIKK